MTTPRALPSIAPVFDTAAPPADRWHVYGLLEEAADRYGDRPYLTGEQSISFAEARDRARALAAWLASRGVVRGDRVLILARNRPEVIVAVFATALVGASFVVVNPQIKQAGLARIVAQCQPKMTICDEVTVTLLDDSAGAVLEIGPAAREGHYHWPDACMARPAASLEFPGIDQDPACLVFTSGSTGEPRGVALSHDNIRFVVERIQARLGYRADDVIGLFLPLSFDYGLYQAFLAAQSGASLHVGRPDQVGPRLLGLLAQLGVTVLPGMPTIYAAMLALLDRRPMPLPRLRMITNTGERLPRAYIDKLRGYVAGLQVFVMYGLTECKRVSIMLPEELEHSPDSVGRALDGTEVFAVDADGNRLPAGETGELAVRGRHVALGYWQAREETAARFRSGVPPQPRVLMTGDRGRVDERGFIYFAARADDMLKHRGVRMSPIETESAACALGAVVEAALAKRERDDTLHLYVTVSGEGATPETILVELNRTLEPAKIPEFVHVVSALPKTINGKIDRKALTALAEHER
jgi:acyl-coenzyme A synthetase/AMP-(fatty) acid ligase